MASDLEQIKKDHHMFGLIRPIGYDFTQVEDAINDYKHTIADIYELLADKDQHIRELEAQRDRLEKEVTDARLQMEAITIPDYSMEQSLNILENFGEGEPLPDAQQGMQQGSQPSPPSEPAPPSPQTQQGIGSPPPKTQNMGQPALAPAEPKLKRKIPKVIH